MFLMAMAAMEHPAQWIRRLDAILARNPTNPDPLILASLAFGLAGTGERELAAGQLRELRIGDRRPKPTGAPVARPCHRGRAYARRPG
jgi:hypothetical protein